MPTLDEVYEEIRTDPYWENLRGPGIRMVPGFGLSQPKVLLVGEAPGATENARGRPFCGPSGRVLDQLMDLAGIALEDKDVDGGLHGDVPVSANAFVTNVVKYRPMGNRTPSLPEILHARDGFNPWQNKDPTVDLARGAGSLRREWQALGGPRAVVCVGAVAHAALSPMNYESLSAWVGRALYRGVSEGRKVWFWSQYHPAFGMRNRGNVRLLERIENDWTDMGKFMREEGLL